MYIALDCMPLSKCHSNPWCSTSWTGMSNHVPWTSSVLQTATCNCKRCSSCRAMNTHKPKFEAAFKERVIWPVQHPYSCGHCIADGLKGLAQTHLYNNKHCGACIGFQSDNDHKPCISLQIQLLFTLVTSVVLNLVNTSVAGSRTALGLENCFCNTSTNSRRAFCNAMCLYPWRLE